VGDQAATSHDWGLRIGRQSFILKYFEDLDFDETYQPVRVFISILNDKFLVFCF
jgi:hypothetical protein